MLKKLGLATLLVGIVALAGCGKKMTCKSMEAKNKKCMDAFVAYAKAQAEENMKKTLEKVPPAMKEKMKKNLEASMKKMAEQMKATMTGDDFIKACEKGMKAKDDKGKKEKKKMENCFKKSDCKEYVKCLMAAAE